MDSVTQFVLGAAVGEAVLGRKEGRRAALWGGVGGTIPDLDVVANYLLSDVDALLAHRALTHSLFFAAALAPLCGWLVYCLYRHRGRSTFRQWTLLFFLALGTHPLLDAFTNYGTMLWYPLSHQRIAWNTIFVIDPGYTLPLLGSFILLMIWGRKHRLRRTVNRIGLIISSLYLIWSVSAKWYVTRHVRAALPWAGLQATHLMTNPAPFNTILWSVIAKTDTGYYVGYYSLLDGTKSLELTYLPQEKALLEPYENNRPVQKLLGYAAPWYIVRQAPEGLRVNLLRFGTTSGWLDLSADYVFSFLVQEENGRVEVRKADPETRPTPEDLEKLWQRLKGQYHRQTDK